MEYKQIVAVTGLPGLFQLLNAQNNGALVKNLSDKGICFISSRKHQLTPLESIEIYTKEGNMRLEEVFTKIKDFDTDALEANTKNDKEHFRQLFKNILPNFDEERVYTSDIKKVFKWYQLLKENDLLHFEKPEEVAVPTETEQAKTADETKPEAVKEKKKAPKNKAKKQPEA